MSTRIEIVDPVQFAGIASEILQAAWKPPCLHYSPDYLSWQFAFSSDLPRVCAIAYVDDRAAGCIAATVRRFTVAGESFPAHHRTLWTDVTPEHFEHHATLLRAAGARALPSSFNPHAFVKGRKHVIETAAALDLEVT